MFFQDKVKFLRIGRTSKIHRDIHEFCIEKLASDIKSTIELEHFLHSQVCIVLDSRGGKSGPTAKLCQPDSYDK